MKEEGERERTTVVPVSDAKGRREERLVDSWHGASCTLRACVRAHATLLSLMSGTARHASLPPSTFPPPLLHDPEPSEQTAVAPIAKRKNCSIRPSHQVSLSLSVQRLFDVEQREQEHCCYTGRERTRKDCGISCHPHTKQARKDGMEGMGGEGERKRKQERNSDVITTERQLVTCITV